MRFLSNFESLLSPVIVNETLVQSTKSPFTYKVGGGVTEDLLESKEAERRSAHDLKLSGAMVCGQYVDFSLFAQIRTAFLLARSLQAHLLRQQ